MFYEGPADAKVLFISDFQRVNCRAEGHVFSEYLGRTLFNAIKSAGLRSHEYAVMCIHGDAPVYLKSATSLPQEQRTKDIAALEAFIKAHPANVLVPLGEYALSVMTGLDSIQKWQCSVVPAKASFGQRKCIPCYHPDYIMRVFGDHAYQMAACLKVKREMDTPKFNIPDRKFHLSPPFAETMKYLDGILYRKQPVAVDFEFGRGQINTVGFAISEKEAIAIKTLPDGYTADEHFALWKKIAEILESEQIAKYVQHFIVEASWAARYGIEMKNVVHDTMWAMKFLHPEFDKGLDNVGRLYTPFPYWKDDNDDWNNIKDWHKHLDYNCKDTTGTFAARNEQMRALWDRGLYKLYYSYVMRFAPIIQEMCVVGLRVNPQALVRLQEKLQREHQHHMETIDRECTAALGFTINPRSPKQLQNALKQMGFKLPTKTVKGKTDAQETTDKKALVKLRRKHPDALILPALIGLSATNKQLSSYASFEYDRTTERVHYSLDGCGTETGRWAGYNSAWGEGFNPQTVPKSVRGIFTADPGKVLVQIDLSQAESRYVAWEAPEPKLMQMLAEKRDVHKYVAGNIFKKPEEFVNPQERQLGKKAGHSSNYDVGPRTFAEQCLVEMNYYITEQEAKAIIDGYNATFPGIWNRKQNIKREVYAKRMLRTPIGRVRHFYGRMDDSTFREAYAYCPQSVIPDITNHLMLKLWENRAYLGLERSEGNYFLLQVHDSLLLQTTRDRVCDIADLARDLKSWHPKISLPGGELWIPVEVEAGENWKQMENV